MSKDNKIKYETDTPVQGEMREHALSALDKFQKFHEEQRTKMSDIERIIDERSFNYYFAEESIVELDEIVIGDDGPGIISPSNITSLLNTSRYQVDKHIKTLKLWGFLDYKSVNYGPEDDYSSPYNGYTLSPKGREEWSIYIKQREEDELKLIKECFG